MAPEPKVQCGGYSNPLTHTMGNYLPIMYSSSLKQMASSTLSKIHNSLHEMGANVF